MDKNITQLNPQAVWKHFAAICAIPHPSGHEKELKEYIVALAKQRKLDCRTDSAGNLTISKPATKGMENRKAVVLQAHLDMVAEKIKGKKFDFTKDPIEAYIEDGWVQANGTTLGADNGMGVAIALAVLESQDIAHGPVQALFTVDKETGMQGAFALDGGIVSGDIMINLDAMTEGVMCVGCAGGMDFAAKFKYLQDRNPYHNRVAVRIEVRGLKGGHSGYDIGLQRANANKILFRFLYLGMKNFDLNIGFVDGGSNMRNVIPREATAVVCGPERVKSDFMYGVEQYEKIIREEYRGIEDDISIKAYDCDVPESTWDKKTMAQVISALCGCPDGIRKLSPFMPGLVETSANLARVYCNDDEIIAKGLIRSSSATEKEAFGNEIAAVFELAGAKVTLDNAYNGWRPDLNSEILSTMRGCYRELFGKEPRITAVHAGLEIGIIAGAVSKTDLIACGPTIRNAHSPNEKVEIETVEKFWKLLTKTLENIPAK